MPKKNCSKSSRCSCVAAGLPCTDACACLACENENKSVQLMNVVKIVKRKIISKVGSCHSWWASPIWVTFHGGLSLESLCNQLVHTCDKQLFFQYYMERLYTNVPFCTQFGCNVIFILVITWNSIWSLPHFVLFVWSLTIVMLDWNIFEIYICDPAQGMVPKRR